MYTTLSYLINILPGLQLGASVLAIRIGINGFGRMGRLALRVGWNNPNLEFVRINELGGPADIAAHLVKFDSQHGTWDAEINAVDDAIEIDGRSIHYTSNAAIEDTPWADVDVVIECTGKFRKMELLQAYLDCGVKKVLVSAPVKDGALNLVRGVNDEIYDPAEHHIVTAASCTTNCIAPVVDVLHREFNIIHGSITTIHDITNTQSVLDNYHKDPRRARASGISLIPTSTNSATAITEIFPELKGKLSGYAVRVPLANASVTDCVFEVSKKTDADAVNAALAEAAAGRLQGILGYEARPLVSVDYLSDPRSSIVDALSTMVIDHTHVKVLAWYDNEMGYVHRMVELVTALGQDV